MKGEALGLLLPEASELLKRFPKVSGGWGEWLEGKIEINVFFFRCFFKTLVGICRIF